MLKSLWNSVFGRPPLRTSIGVLDLPPVPKAGAAVNPESVLQLATAFACTRVTAQVGGALPAKLYKRSTGSSRDVADQHPLHGILAYSPNSAQTPMEFTETMIGAMLLTGNAYAEITRNSKGALISVEPFQIAMRPVRGSNGLHYEGQDRGQKIELPVEKVFHVRAFGLGGDEGLSAIRHGVQTFSSATATDEVAARVFANGLHSSGIFQAPADVTLTEEQRQQLEVQLSTFAGSNRAGKTMVLEGGFTFQPIQMNLEDAQMLATRRFNIEEICRWFGVPPIIIGHAGEGQTMFGSGVEQIMMAWLTLGLNPLLRRLEQRMIKDLLPPQEREQFYPEFNRDALMQADSEARAKFLGAMVQNGLMTRNEARALMNLPKSADPNADQLTAQINLAPLSRLGETRAFTPEAPNNVP